MRRPSALDRVLTRTFAAVGGSVAAAGARASSFPEPQDAVARITAGRTAVMRCGANLSRSRSIP
jgi:hypothetical protein